MIDKLYYLPVDGSFDDEIFRWLFSFVSVDKQKQVIKLNNVLSKKLTLYAEVLIRIIACNDLGVQNTEITFLRNDYGKPKISEYPEYHFNISHTNKCIIAAFSNYPIGVDIEKVSKPDIRIAERFFTAAELKHILRQDSGQNERFYEIWTKKEAYIKYLGKGFFMPLSSFNVLSKDLSVYISNIRKEDYMISVCSENQNYSIYDLTEEKFYDLAKKSFEAYLQ